ncbi:cilia- and flagella-associated protein 65 isoform X2 [Halyomorpha halys]|uniref:cilia- and flagella-associated protein 65 isoform X2 n=1 Tax=Halyomorpha halys TaxID=286706 RepID=UPI0034D32143
MENICHGPFPPDSITTEFPDCIPGNEYVKLLDWPYASKIVAIEREKTTDPREWMFEVTEEPPPAKGLRIIYKPVLPFTENYDYFYLKTATKDRITLNIKGSTVGPNVFFKTDHLVFDCKDCQATKKKIIMENKGLMDTLFCFDIDNCCSDVDICPRYGTIEMNGKIELMVTFHPTRASFTFRKIFCIVHYQEPIFITIRANYKKISAFTEFNDYIHFQVPFSEYPNKFEAYIQDVASVLFVEKPPLLSLDRRYIDFGMVDATKGGRIASEQFSITNNGDVKLCIIWLIGERSEFTIDPPKIEIEANERMSLWARFKPTFPDQLHSAKITAGIHWGTNNDFTVPFPLSVDLLAHTFTIMRTGWDPFFKCVDKVILPATIPSMPCFGTYRLMNTGRFPIIFKFIPPSVTNLTMKPLHGLIEGDSFQLFALRFLPGLKADIAYTEKWILEINFFQKMEVEFTTTAELPYLIFSNKEPVKFSHTSLHSDISISVPVKNNTRLKTSFNLAPQDTEIPFYIENPVTTVSPNELTHVTLHFNPHRYGKFESHMVFDMKCLTSLGQTHCSCIVVKVMGVCSRVTLKAMPSSLYLGEILMGCWLYGTFKIKNTGKCDALLDTIGMPRSHGDEDVITKVEPKAFIIPAMSKLNITVGVCPQEVGFKNMKIAYFLCTDRTLTKHIEETPTSLMTFEVNCSAPKLSIIDIRVSRHRQTLAKYFIWKKLQINKVNKALGKLKFKPEEKEIAVYMKLPVGALNNPPIQIDLLVKNLSAHEARLDIKFEKLCSCKPVIENPKEEGIVTINCKYTDHSKKSFKFILSVTATQDEKIHGYTVLWVERVCGKPGKQYLDFNQPTSLTTTVMVKAYPVYVGDPCKPTQVIWTYNNFNEEISYKIENNDSDELQIFYFPHPEGIIAAHSAHPLVFNFNPYQYKTYTKTFNLVTPHVTYVLHMMGVGSIAPCYSTYAMQNKVPVISLFNDNQDEIEVSIDHLSLKPMLLHSTVKRMVFLKNKMNEPVEFCWAMRRFGAMFHVKAVPQDGVLEPNQLEPVQIIIQSLSIPSRLTIFITCKFVYLERLQSYKDKMENIRKFGKVFDCCFSMTEKNEFIPIDMSLGSGSKSFPTYFNVTLSLHSISERYLDDIMPNKKHQMKILSQAKIETKNNIRLALTRNEGAICIDVFTRVMWEILNRKIFLESVSNIKQTTYYRDIADAEKMMPLVEAPKTLVLNVLNTAIFKALLQMFAIDSEWTKDTSIIIPQQGDDNVLKTRGKMSNKYYGDILEHGFYHIVSLFIGSFNYERRYSDVAHLPKRIKFLKTLKD